MNKGTLLALLMTLVLASILAACSTQSAATANSSIDAAALVDNNCAKCHGLDQLSEGKRSADGWVKIVDQMDKKGSLGFTADEKTAVAAYLADKYK